MTRKQLKYYFDFVSYPSLLATLVVLDRARLIHQPLLWTAVFAAGFLAWTLAEYWVHRSLLHGPYWMGVHEIHHKRPKDLTDFPVWQIPAYFAAIASVTWLAAGPWFCPAFAGVITGWVLFFVMHHTMHHHPEVIPDFSIRHNAHHKLTSCNYGITVDWWDRVFGTMRR